MSLLTHSVLATAPVHTVLPASDIKRAEAFYRDVLGLETEYGERSGPGFVARSGEGTFVYVYETTAHVGEATTAMFHVKDLDSAMSDLRERGVVFEEYTYPTWHTVNGVATMDGGRGAWFKDSEGNIINVAEMPISGM